MKTLVLDFNGTRVKFSTNLPKYHEYLSAYFAQIIDTTGAAVDLDITFDWSEKSLNQIIDDCAKDVELVKIGANTLAGAGHVVTIKKLERRWKVLFDARQQAGRFSLKAYFQRKKGKDFFRFGPFSKPAHEWFFSLTYYLLYYPLFWFLAVKKVSFPLHASAIAHPKGGLVICGLEGIGKTSLGLKFLGEPNTSLLSDNLIFFDKQQVYPCYELIRMHAGESESLWTGHFERIENFNIQKGFFRPKYTPFKGGVKPAVLVFPEFSSSFFCKEIDLQEAVGRALALTHLPAEINNYGEYRNLFNLMHLGFAPEKTQRASLEGLLAGVRCVRIGMLKSDGLDENYKKVRNLIFP